MWSALGWVAGWGGGLFKSKFRIMVEPGRAAGLSLGVEDRLGLDGDVDLVLLAALRLVVLRRGLLGPAGPCALQTSVPGPAEEGSCDRNTHMEACQAMHAH